ncbi:unnamed protein product [Heligmosomoides polygyrus]|uniref:Uncharacterized protein n=1 Tax=Heligmosomoides polygyrus TaxID=6339 RepID=A0A183GKN1_HELPZ|nr:unnamed protein product [Heligmosomoides polygyrus]
MITACLGPIQGKLRIRHLESTAAEKDAILLLRPVTMSVTQKSETNRLLCLVSTTVRHVMKITRKRAGKENCQETSTTYNGDSAYFQPEKSASAQEELATALCVHSGGAGCSLFRLLSRVHQWRRTF